ncbi:MULTISPECIES: flagellar export protein FliJ [Pseudomonadaceae]|uniref:flagellar export protein FliJ n=1 Tax=Pseudomonadaceae TaxID=135621 RepID=UPI00103F3214|nr:MULTISPECIES: flagellar export protein FliJ [Pseudomonadaceae]MBA1277361.1 flagella biosynthesis chaperone FliJ [Stutzerimonas stutzeri]MBC8651775.1 flagella biosynthesis chaperone FliJ [Pseudomonas sp. MT4]QXY91411.1 flagella biosynthesis chaperone FliJ [Pseudomonas sp. MTM4]TCD21154.1 flagella biosynthesis chaperone FliJ [Pseudomonas sp. IC_126]
MATSRAARLAPVIDMAERAERDAAGQFGQGQTQLSQAETKLGELRQYFSDYQQQWMSQGSQGVSGQWLVNYQRFLSQLESAIAQQQRSVDWHRNNLDKLREQWQQRRARLDGLRKLVDRYIQEARTAADKREQKLLDEFSQRLASRPRQD